LIAPLLPPWVTGLLLLGAGVVDALNVLVHVYGFTFTDLPGMVRNLFLLDAGFVASRSLGVVGIAVVAVLPSFLLWRWLSPRLGLSVRRAWMLTVVMGAIAVRVADVGIGAHGPVLDVRGTPQRLDIASAPSITLLRGALAGSATLQPARSLPAAALGSVRAALVPGAEEIMVLILVESFGLPADPALHVVLLAPLRAAARDAGYSMVEDTLQVRGHTTEAEFRVLCGRRMDFPQLTPQIGATCLPARLREAGWEVTAFHAFTGRFFGREVWYPRIGLQDVWFREQLAPLALPDCGRAFRGPCDSAMATVVSKAITTPSTGKRRLVYWLTLSTHLPVDATTGAALTCAGTPVLSVTSGVCSHASELATTIRAIARLVRSVPAAHARIVIVGDHPPPFARVDERRVWSEGRVPSFVLTPLGEARAASGVASPAASESP
jgi:hypothetical protein